MSNHQEIRKYLEHQEKFALPKLRWLQVKTMVEQYPNDADLGGKVRELYWKDTK